MGCIPAYAWARGCGQGKGFGQERGCVDGEGVCGQGVEGAGVYIPKTATEAHGTHTTGMYSFMHISPSW